MGKTSNSFFSHDMLLQKAQIADLCSEYNHISAFEIDKRDIKIKAILGKTGHNIYVQNDFHCDVGKNISVGENFYSNYNLTVLDVGKVKIGHDVLIGPNVDIYTINHDVDAAKRERGVADVKPVTIGNHVWIGGRVVINPGVTIGDNAVIASGAIVTHDIPAHSLAAGIPAKKIKDI